MTERLTSSMSKPLRWLLIASLAVNLLVAGLAAGSALRVWGGGKPPGASVLQLGPFLRALPREDRQAIGDVIREQLPDRRDSGREVMDQALALLEAETFDPEAFAMTLRGARDERREAQDAAFEVFMARITEMTAQERQAYAQALRDR